ncbi:MAG: hypothetical protein J5588_06330 [Bacteroidales bacterium]|nr:hypothetical protein [Bacteroidales bacterium]
MATELQSPNFPQVEGTVLSPIPGYENLVTNVKVNGNALQITNHEVDIPVKAQNQSVEDDNFSKVVTHNLGYYPLVQVVDSNGDVVLADIHHDSVNQCTISVTESINGGKIIIF